jgi:hypothetical protein
VSGREKMREKENERERKNIQKILKRTFLNE